MKNKALILVVIISLLLCSSFAAAGLSDMLTGKFSFGNLFRVKEAEPQQAHIVVEPDCGDGICEASESSQTCPEDCGEPELGNVVYADTLASENNDYVTVDDELKVNAHCELNSCWHAIEATTAGAGMALKAKHLAGTEAHIATSEFGVYGESSTDSIVGENENGNLGKLGTLDYGVYGENEDSANFGYLGGDNEAVYGEYSSGDNSGSLGGSSFGVLGHSNQFYGVSGSSVNGLGVKGYSQTNNGVSGESDSDDGVSGTSIDGAGVNGYSANSIGVVGNCGAAGCYGLYTDKTVYAGTGVNTPNGDVAEYLPSQDKLEPGDVVVLDLKNSENVIKSRKAHDTTVAGIISTEPGVSLGKEKDGNLLALAGRVPTKVSAENGAIQIGDLLTTSSTPGHAMKCLDRFECSGVMVGKALEPLKKGTGKIIVLVTLA